MKRLVSNCLLLLVALASVSSFAQDAKPAATKLDTSRGDKMLAEYFQIETAKLKDACLADIKTLDDWNAKKGEYRRQLLEMLGLDPLPERTDLKPVITGKLEEEEFVVEKLHFQSRPGLYVTGNLYLPKKIEKPLPTILYVCGHGREVKDGVPLGAKTHYQHHGAWFARNGYACLTIDTLQLGEIEGIHHGTHRYGMWWWLNRGYTPAGVEAWNCMRAVDYLETRPEVDKTRFGVTGRSGGGAYSWWIAATDERIKCAVPTAGITDLQNHVVDGCVEGHCDCMYMVNTYRWDYPLVAALVAPRPLLIANTDTDRIFPLDGVYRTFEQVRRIYRLHEPADKGASARVALSITSGPHLDTQELQTHAFRWFNHHLKGDDSLIDSRTPKFFAIEQLKVFDKLPEDEINTKIHETFVAKAASPEVLKDKAEWENIRQGWMQTLKEKAFRAWENESLQLTLKDGSDGWDEDGVVLTAIDVTGQNQWPLRIYLAWSLALNKEMQNSEVRADLVVLNLFDDRGWMEFLATARPGFERILTGETLPPPNKKAYTQWTRMLKNNRWIMAYVAPRGVGPSAFDQSERKQVQNPRRFYLLGQTLDAQRVWDVRRAIQALQSDDNPITSHTPLWLQANGSMAGVTLYASLFEPDIKRLDLYDLPKSHREGPIFLNVERYLDMPQAVAMAAERSNTTLYQDDDTGWEYPQSVAKQLGWDAKQIQIRRKPPKE
jgi:Prolyl oligopeptidase family